MNPKLPLVLAASAALALGIERVRESRKTIYRPGYSGLSDEDHEALRARRKRERQARKKNRRR